MTMMIEQKVGESGLCEVWRTVRKILDAAKSAPPDGHGRAAHKDLAERLRRARQVQEVKRMQVTKNLSNVELINTLPAAATTRSPRRVCRAACLQAC